MLWNINILHFNIALLRVAQSNVKNTILPSNEAKIWLIMAWSGFKRLKQSHEQIMYNDVTQSEVNKLVVICYGLGPCWKLSIFGGGF